MPESVYDVVVIGGGPSGVACALSILKNAKNIKLAIITGDSQLYIGEVVNESIRSALQYLNLEEIMTTDTFIHSSGIVSTWGGIVTQRNAMDGVFSKSYLLDRKKFNHLLLDSLKKLKGALFENTKVINLLQDKDIWHLKLKNSSDDLRAKYVVDATGRSSQFFRTFNTKRIVDDNLIGVSRFYSHSSSMTVINSVLIEPVEYGWWYSSVLPNNHLIATLMCDKSMIKSHKMTDINVWKTMVNDSTYLKERLKKCTLLDEKAKISSAKSYVLDPACGKNWMCVGDASSAFDPLSSMGIGYAMISGIHAGNAIFEKLENNNDITHQYTQDVKRNYDSYLMRKKQFYRSEERWKDSPFWKNR